MRNPFLTFCLKEPWRYKKACVLPAFSRYFLPSLAERTVAAPSPEVLKVFPIPAVSLPCRRLVVFGFLFCLPLGGSFLLPSLLLKPLGILQHPVEVPAACHTSS
jgi:hypothetical protein